MMKTLNKIVSLLTMLITFSAATAFAQNSFYLNRESAIEPGTSGILEFMLDNDMDFYGFQAQITLPEGIEIEKKDNGDLDIALTSRADEGYRAITNLKGTTLHIGVFSTSDAQNPFTGSSGALLNIAVKASSSFRGGDANITNIKFIKSGDQDEPLLESSTYINILPIYIKIIIDDNKDNTSLLFNAVGETGSLTVDPYPENAIITSLTWESKDPSVATIEEKNGKGLVTAVDNGTTTIEVTTDNGKTAECTVVVGQRVDNITLDKTQLDLYVGQQYDLTETIEPPYAINKEVNWESDNEEVATVDEYGNVTAHALGEANITAIALGGNKKNAICTVHVIPTPAEKVIVTPESAELIVGQTEQLVAEVLPADTTYPTVTWASSNTTVATVDQEGKVTALAIGETVISATCGDATGESRISVIPTPAESIILDKDRAELKAGETTVITATVLPEDTFDKTVTWTSSDETIATVDENGKVTAATVGEAIITAQCGNAKATCTITVIPTPVESVTLDKTTAELKVGETLELKETVLPEDATDKSVNWTTSDASIATVDENGIVTAHAIGEATIIVKSVSNPSAVASCTITVLPIPVISITLDRDKADLIVDDTITLVATVLPEDATDKTVTWTSSDETIATVDANGTITAIAPGEATITASCGENSATCIVTVSTKVVPATGISLNKDREELIVGDTSTLIATVTPEDATDKTVIWTSSDETIATVDANGTITAIAPGEATITASCGENSATCIVTVSPRIIPATGISLNKDREELIVGDTSTLIATVTPEDATDKTVTWSSSDETIATVDANGTITAIAPGEATITASCGENSATCIVTVSQRIIPATGISLNKDREELIVGDTSTLIATVTPEDATDKTVTWTSSDETIATVDANGTITAIAPGEATITASCGENFATCFVTVSPRIIPATGISLNKDREELIVGDTSTLIATVTPEDATDKTVTWTSSDETIATVDPNGTITAIAPGEATITASCGENSATCVVTVSPKVVPATGISLNKDREELIVGDTSTLIATVTPEDATDKTVTWSSNDETIATVDANGTITAIAPGEAIITASCGNNSATCVVNVSQRIIPATGISLNKDREELIVGDTSTLIATVTPEDATDKTVTWTSSDETIATVDANGTITAIAPGEATITASCGENSATCVVTVSQRIIPATGISLNKDREELIVGDTSTLIATVTPEDTTDKTVTWTSSDETIATVDANGTITAIAPGEATITASCGENSATCVVTVSPRIIPATGISLNKDREELIVGDTSTLIATVTPENATDKTVTWSSSDETIATVDANGTITAIAPGEATITASCGENSATCIVTVSQRIIPATGISLNKDREELIVGDTSTLIATVTPEDATDKTVTWTSSDETIATVDANGTITAIAPGEATITASCGENSATCIVNVSQRIIPATGISLNKDREELIVGDTSTLIATVTPEDATDKTVTWTSSDETIATVDANGTITAITPGTATVIASCGGNSATCVVTVSPKVVPATGISLNKDREELIVGDTSTLIATVTPEDATDKTVIWTSSDETIAIVDANGIVTAVAPGEATITASCGGNSATCVVTVTPRIIPATGISLNKDREELVVGDTSTLIATVTPEDATDKTVTWTSSDETIATIDSNGTITAIAPGEAIITASCGNNSATCVVTVSPRIIPATGIYLDKEHETLKVGETTIITATVLPENATDKTVTWTSSDETIAKVDANGVVTAIALGTTEITATSGDAIATCKVTVIPTLAESITLSQDAASLEVGETVLLIATVYPENTTDKTVTWSSNNEDIATVDSNGNVLAKALGEVDIIARCGNATAICKVTVVPTKIGSISLSNTTLFMIVGDKTDLTASIFPSNATDPTLTWKSSDESIVTVSGSGMTIEVSALKAGLCTITVSSKEGISAICEVTVSIIPVEKILLDKTVLKMTEGESDTITATILPENATDKSVTWKSSDTNVATVTETGDVTAVGIGNAIIYASSSNGITAECAVTVDALIIEPTAVTINNNGVTLRVGQSHQLSATVSPANTTNPEVTWKSGDESIATIDANGNVTAIALGEATITASCGNVSGECTVYVVPTPVESITLSNTELILKEGDFTDIYAIINPIDATDKTLIWTSSDESVMTLTENTETTIENGVKLDVTAHKAGTAIITVLSPNEGKSATCKVIVNIIPVESISLDKSILNLIEGQSDTLTATITPDNASDKTVTWKSSDPAIATVSNNGEVTATGVGTATIYASSSNGLTAECKVEVAARIIYATAIVLDKESADLEVGQNLKLTATVVPDNVTDPTLTWTSSDESIAIVDADGNVTAVALGTATITVKCGEVSAACLINVVPTPATDMSLSQYELLMREGYTADLIAIVYPDNATDKSVLWKSSDEAIASVDANGTVTAIKTGVVVITATTNNVISKECVVTVVPDVIAVTKIEIVEKPRDGSSIEMDKETSIQLTARIEPENATDKTVTWKSSNEAVATVSESGVVTAIKEGTATIYASSSNGLTDECPITVLLGEVPVESISLSNSTLLLREEVTTNLIAIVRPDNATDKEVIWTSSDESVATVDQSGNVTAISVGNAIIKATSHYDSSIYDTCEVTVEKEDVIIAVTGIHIVEKPIDGSPLQLEKEETIQLHAKIEPEDATDKSVTWKSSDRSIATVSEDGFVTAISAGEVTIYASSSNGLTDEIRLTILRGIIPVESITLSNTELLMRAGAATTLIAIIYPEDADDKLVIWSSSDESVATVDQEGNITAISGGVATITAASHFDPTIKKDCIVTVAGIIAVEDLLLDRTELDLIVGDTEKLTATVVPDDATDKAVTWKSSDKNIAVVDESGVVSAVSPGSAIIYASSSNGITKECKVTVLPKIIDVTSVTLDKDMAILEVGQSVVLTPTIAPEDASDKTIVWKTSDETIASVDDYGNVIAKALGNVIITATCGNAQARCDVEVVPTMPTGISLTNSELTLTEGTTSDLIAIVRPDNATDKSVNWTSDNEEIVTVDGNGIVTAIKPGTAVVTATTVNGLQATCTVTVIPVIIDPTDISLEKELQLTEGDTYSLTATVTPDNATDKTITWRSSNTSVATVEDGIVTAISTGNAIIFASTSNGKTAECNVTVVARIIPASTIILDIEDAELHVGDQIRITPTVAPENATDKTVTWKSSDAAIATVDDNGNITALALGEATITATCGDVSATCLVKVVPILPTSITLSNTELIMREGYTSDLIAIVLPTNATDKTVVWNSDNESVASVNDQGIVTAIKAGTATIVATTHNGLIATCTVTVVPEPIQQATGITLNKAILNLYVEDSEQLIATITPDDTADKTVTWISLDQSIATVDAEGVVTGLAPGTAVIMASTANGLSATCEVIVKLNIFDDGILCYRVITDDTVEVIGLVDPDEEEVAIKTNAIYTSPYVTLEFTVTNISDDAFINCPNLKKVVLFTEAIPGIVGNPFPRYTTIYVADPEEYKNDTDWGKLPNTIKGYVTIEAPAENPLFIPNSSIQIDSDIVIKDKITYWTSSNEAIATVDNTGRTYPHYVGHTTITATCDGYSDSFVLTVNPQRGDANWDGVINVADPVNIANYVVKKNNNLINWEPYQWGATSSWNREYWNGFYNISSDINGQEGITVSDASEAVSIILDQSYPSTTARMIKGSESLDEDADKLTPCKVRSYGSNGFIIPVNLEDSKEYVALQADIRVAEPLTIEDVKAGRRVVNHKLSTRRIDENTIRIVLFDLNNNVFADNGEAILELAVNGYPESDDFIEITNIVASDINSNAHILIMRPGEGITDVESISKDNISIYSETNQLIIQNARGRHISVHTMDGSTVESFVAGSDYETISLTKGIYVVTVDNKSAKFAVK